MRIIIVSGYEEKLLNEILPVRNKFPIQKFDRIKELEHLKQLKFQEEYDMKKTAYLDTITELIDFLDDEELTTLSKKVRDKIIGKMIGVNEK